jgi:endonuclease YncB( thermonuclease family)
MAEPEIVIISEEAAQRYKNRYAAPKLPEMMYIPFYDYVAGTVRIAWVDKRVGKLHLNDEGYPREPTDEIDLNQLTPEELKEVMSDVNMWLAHATEYKKEPQERLDWLRAHSWLNGEELSEAAEADGLWVRDTDWNTAVQETEEELSRRDEDVNKHADVIKEITTVLTQKGVEVPKEVCPLEIPITGKVTVLTKADIGRFAEGGDLWMALNRGREVTINENGCIIKIKDPKTGALYNIYGFQIGVEATGKPAATVSPEKPVPPVAKVPVGRTLYPEDYDQFEPGSDIRDALEAGRQVELDARGRILSIYDPKTGKLYDPNGSEIGQLLPSVLPPKIEAKPYEPKYSPKGKELKPEFGAEPYKPKAPIELTPEGMPVKEENPITLMEYKPGAKPEAYLPGKGIGEAIPVAKDESEIIALKRTVEDNTYRNYWKRLTAIRRLGEMDNINAAKLLIPLLDNSEAAIREAAVIALGGFTDPESLKLLTTKALVDTATPVRRANAAWALGNTRNQAILQPLINRMKSEQNPVVLVRIIESVSMITGAEQAASDLHKLITHTNPEVRAAAVKAIGIIGLKDLYNDILQRIKDTDLKVRIAVLDTLTKLDPVKALPYLQSAQKDPNHEIRVVALENIIKAEPGADIVNKAATDALLDKDSAVKTTAQIIKQIKPEPAPGETVPTFFGIEIAQKNITFAIDFSGSMKDTVTTPEGLTRTKIDMALTELEKTVQALPPDAKINLIIINTEAKGTERQAFTSLVPATAENKAKLISHARKVWTRLSQLERGRGDHYDALIQALSDPSVNTIILLSDGVPTYGTYVDPKNIIDRITELNRTRKVTIDTVMTGKGSAGVDFMQKLAEKNNGESSQPLKVAPKVTQPKEAVRTREQELFALNQAQQESILISLGVAKKDIPRYEKDRVAKILELERKKESAVPKPPGVAQVPKPTNYIARYVPPAKIPTPTALKPPVIEAKPAIPGEEPPIEFMPFDPTQKTTVEFNWMQSYPNKGLDKAPIEIDNILESEDTVKSPISIGELQILTDPKYQQPVSEGIRALKPGEVLTPYTEPKKPFLVSALETIIGIDDLKKLGTEEGMMAMICLAFPMGKTVKVGKALKPAVGIGAKEVASWELAAKIKQLEGMKFEFGKVSASLSAAIDWTLAATKPAQISARKASEEVLRSKAGTMARRIVDLESEISALSKKLTTLPTLKETLYGFKGLISKKSLNELYSKLLLNKDGKFSAIKIFVGITGLSYLAKEYLANVTHAKFIYEEGAQTIGITAMYVDKKDSEEIKEIVNKQKALLQETNKSWIPFFGPLASYRQFFDGVAFQQDVLARRAEKLSNEEKNKEKKIPTLPEEIKAEVREIVDGDTIDMIYDGHRYPVRLVGTNSPEKGETAYSSAKKWLSDQIFGKTVTIKIDQKHPIDTKYNRILGTIWYSGKDINMESIRKGWAYYYPVEANKFTDAWAYEQAQKDAEAENRGIWAGSKIPTLSEIKDRWMKGIITDDEAKIGMENLLISPENVDANFKSWKIDKTKRTTGLQKIAPSAKSVLSRDEELKKMNKDEQTQLLYSLGVAKKDIPQYEKDRIAKIIQLETSTFEKAVVPMVVPELIPEGSWFKPGKYYSIHGELYSYEELMALSGLYEESITDMLGDWAHNNYTPELRDFVTQQKTKLQAPVAPEETSKPQTENPVYIQRYISK